MKKIVALIKMLYSFLKAKIIARKPSTSIGHSAKSFKIPSLVYLIVAGGFLATALFLVAVLIAVFITVMEKK